MKNDLVSQTPVWRWEIEVTGQHLNEGPAVGYQEGGRGSCRWSGAPGEC